MATDPIAALVEAAISAEQACVQNRFETPGTRSPEQAEAARHRRVELSMEATTAWQVLRQEVMAQAVARAEWEAKRRWRK